MIMFSSGGGMGMGGGDIGSHLGQLFGGLFGNSGSPYEDAMKQYEKWAGKGEATQNPFLEFGKAGMPMFQDWLKGMQDPSKFINNLMGGYQESPFAKFQQEQGMRAAQNMGSASGLTGSTPLTQFAQENAQNISSKDMQDWLGRVLGVNTQYGQGLGQQIGVGQNAANALTNMFGDMGRQMGEAAYGRQAGRNQDRMNTWGGLFNLAGDVGKMFL
jgi:hypothetical protein